MTTKTKKPVAKKVKSSLGRPTDFKPETLDEILNSIRAGVPIKMACLTAGVDDSTYYRWTKRGSEELYRMQKENLTEPRASEKPYCDFFKAVTRAREEAKAAHIAVIAKAAKQGDWRASAWWLSRQVRDEFGDTPPATQAQTINNTLNITTTMAELEQILEAIESKRTKAIDVATID
jgi:hypothetical protein